MDRTAVVIPAYNAGKLLGGVIESVAEMIARERIIVVDDGSSDNTAELAEAAGVVVIRHPGNRGKGAALITGLDKAHEIGSEYAITLDADGQHAPGEIPRFLEKAAETGADIIVGNRMRDIKDMPPIRIMTNRLTSWVVSKKAGQTIPDSQNGYRLIRTALFKKLQFETSRYEWESEILIKAGKLGARISDIPTATIYGEERSSINPLVDTLRFFRLVIKSFFW
jgi:glycosyltransferase involved in cell wall biosynthesis